ncbi:hypothetical protein TKK_0008389 [Trichogramma kaykai]
MATEQRIQACTTATSEKCTFTWVIKNYRLIKLKAGEKIESPKFGVGSDDKKYFQLLLYPEGDNAEDEGYISLFLKPEIDPTNKPDKLVCRWSVSVINDKNVVTERTLHYNFATSNFSGYGSPTFYALKNIDKLIASQNTVTIQCELEVFKEFKSSLNCPDIIDGKNQIIDKVNLDPLCLSEEFSDVRIITPDANDIPAHKSILAMASPVFRAMFTHDMLENKESSVKITDITKNIVTEMLRFIYTGHIDAIEADMIIELLKVADMYQIDSLKTKCEKMLCAHLSFENAIKILIAAHKYKAKYLEDETLKFVTTNTELLCNFEKMKEIGDLDIMINLMQSIVGSQKK